jgi:outer membrane protein TolC
MADVVLKVHARHTPPRLSRHWLRASALALLLASSYQPVRAQPPRELTLRAAATLASHEPPAVLRALAAVEQAQAELETARGSYFPTVRGELVAATVHEQQRSEARDGNTQELSATGLRLLGEARAEWVITNFGARKKLVEEARAQVDVKEADAELAQMSAVRAASELFVRVITSERLVQDSLLSVERRDAMLVAIKRLIDAGLRPRVDLSRAEIEAVAVRYGVDVLRARLAADRAALATALGHAPDTPITLVEHEPTELEPRLSLGQTMTSATKRRPELHASQSRVAMTRARLGQLRAQRRPVIGLMATGNYQRDDRQGNGAIDGKALVGMGGAFLRFDVLDVVTWRGAEAGEHALAVEHEGLATQELATRGQAALAHIELTRASAELEQAQKILEAARVTREAQHRRYSVGEASLLELLDAEAVEQEARARRILSLRDRELACIRLLDAAGLLSERLLGRR